MKRMRYGLCLAMVALLSPLQAQQGGSVVPVTAVQQVKFPDGIDNVGYCDGTLLISSGGTLYAVSGDDGHYRVDIDTTALMLEKGVDYMVRCAQMPGSLFFTRKDSKGRSLLYERYTKAPGKYGERQVKLGKFNASIEHPVFSSDGRALVFVSDSPLGFGGKDLWYSELRNEEWQAPRNLGRRLNSEGDEMMPFIYGDFILFASNGRSDSRGGLDLYAARLVAREQTSDTVSPYPIGFCSAYTLDVPFCSANDDLGLVVNADGNGGWWMVRKADGTSQLMAFGGSIHLVRYAGQVTDADGNPLSEVTVKVVSGGKQLVNTHSDAQGRYYMLLSPGQPYEVLFEAADYYKESRHLAAARKDEETFYATGTMDVTMHSFEMGKGYRFMDLFNSPVSSELSMAGRRRLDSLAKYLTDNPHLHLTVVSAFRNSSDIAFCELVNEARRQTVVDYLVEKGVRRDAVMVSTVVPQALAEGQSQQATTATQASSQTVYFVFSK